MEKNYIPSDSLMELELLTDRSIGIHYHNHFELLYVLSGELDLTADEEHIHMETEDIVIVNTNRNHSYEASEHIFIARFLISYDKLRELLNRDNIIFLCNSANDKNEIFDTLRDVIRKILNQFLKGGDAKLYLNSLYYQMLYILTSNFLLTEKNIRYQERGSSDERVREVFSYIRMNYRQNITLQEVSGQLFLSPAYLSKYIKKKCGMNFGELINSVRMEHAMEDLLYTDFPVMKIAMDNGFASVAAYNKVFKEAHHVTPSEFRKKMRHKAQDSGQQSRCRREQLQKRIESFLEQGEEKDQEKKDVRIIEVCIKDAEIGKVENNICTMMNAGAAPDILKSSFQKQILAVKDRLGLKYLRFWDIYAPELLVDIHADRNHLNFGQLDLVFDFLVQNKIKPYVDLGFKTVKLLKNAQNALKKTDRDNKFRSDDEMWNFYDRLIHHFIKRYGEDEVESWYFEYWENWEERNILLADQSYRFREMTAEGHEKYMHCFDILAGALKSRLENVKVGGAGFPLQHYGRQGFAEILRRWKNHPYRPDFISITSFPYQQEKSGFTYYEKKNMDADFVCHNIELAKEVMKKEGFSETALHVSEYSMSLSNRNIVNDSCINGAFLMRTAISCSSKADMLGYWLLTDAYSDFYDTQKLLFGGCGLLTKNGIPKPGFYALEFFGHLFKKKIAQGKNYIVTKDEKENYRIVCCNFKALNYNYYIATEDEIQIGELPGMLEDREYIKINFRISPVCAQSYKIKQNIVNTQHGSIQDEWRDMDMTFELSREEQEYLSQISVPKLLIQKAEIDKDCLEYTATLRPNEIQYISIEKI